MEECILKRLVFVCMFLFALINVLFYENCKVFAEEGDIQIDENSFPDEIFRKYVSDNFDKNHDTVLTLNERNSVSDINVNNMNISKLTGIEYFGKITSLYCNRNNLQSIDLSNNTRLQYLHCCDNQLESLDVSNNKDLMVLYAIGNKFENVDISNSNFPNALYYASRDSQDTYFNYYSQDYVDVEYDADNHILKYNQPPVLRDFQIIAPKEVRIELGSEFKYSGAPYTDVYASPKDTATAFDVEISNPAVISKEKYNLKAVGEGKCKITIHTVNGGLVAEYNVIVREKFDDIAIDENTFPDKNFREYVLNECDKDGSQSLSVSEIIKTNSIIATGREIKNLQGIDYFYRLSYLASVKFYSEIK